MTSSAPAWNVPGRVVGYWNEPVSVETAVNRQSAIGLVIGQRATLSSRKINSPVRRLARGNPVHVGVARVAFVMVNVDENFPVGDALAGLAEPLETRAVGGDDAVEFLAALRFLKQAVGVEKFVFLRDGILVPADDFFAFVLQRQREAELRADAVAVRPDVADDAKSFVLADDFENPVNDFGIAFHDSSVDGLSLSNGAVFSSSSMICSTRLPRTMESSKTNFSVGVYFKTTGGRPGPGCGRDAR